MHKIQFRSSFNVFKHLLLTKTNVLKTCRKSVLALKGKQVQGIFGKTFILALLSSAVLGLQNRVSDFF